MEIPRLHYLQISSNPIHWIEFFREIRNPLPEWQEQTVYPGEELNLSGIAYRVYKNTDLAYVIREALGLDDSMTRVEAGTVFRLPTPVWLRERIIYHNKRANMLDNGQGN